MGLFPWINKVDGISEIESWGVVWSTRKFRCYLDKREFDLYTDHQALTWIFSPGNRTSNAKLARWAMELSNLQFKVYHKPGTAMGHVDGLSRLPVERVAALTMADLLNPTNGPFPEGPLALEIDPSPDEEDEEDEVPPWESPVDPVDAFRLDSEQLVVEQQSVSWIKVLCECVLKDGGIPINPFLRTQIVKMALGIKSKKGFEAPSQLAGSCRTCPYQICAGCASLLQTVLHFSHGDVMSAHLGVSKTPERVRQQAFWPGWRKDLKEFVRGCSYCGAGKGSLRWRAGQMQRMPIVDLTGLFSLVVVDAVGPLVSTERNSKYILVFVDYFTRWAKVSRLNGWMTFVETLVNGVVSGSKFISDLTKSFYETLEIKKRFGRHIILKLRLKKIGTSIFLVYYSLNEQPTMRLLEIPLFSLYGRDPVLPLDHKSLRDARHVVERQLVKAQDRHEKRLQHQETVHFEIGDPVWVYQFFRSRRGENRIKKFEVEGEGADDGPLGETDLPSSSFTERLTVAQEDTVIAESAFSQVTADGEGCGRRYK
ncbi:LOW QUALITY PROTEIN: hypothetical protein PHMEG_00010280 [Phytophthora megakarya]|uniref:Integrase zinc-binding domain-containing protein n=1 Tax=Phytophthora megakarya TaxID=4795 RepID=A0A225WE27_9STRA|nr:LOW QUALITY PROTEIN: hypothetical protein PHMEG_00010280 [Phytophthora megakarya]